MVMSMYFSYSVQGFQSCTADFRQNTVADLGTVGSGPFSPYLEFFDRIRHFKTVIKIFLKNKC